MALGAMAKYPGLDVKIVPCGKVRNTEYPLLEVAADTVPILGLNYFHAHKFRSRAVIEFGNPLTIPAELVEKFKAGGTEKREACSTLLDSICNALKTVTVNAGSYETLMVKKKKKKKGGNFIYLCDLCSLYKQQEDYTSLLTENCIFHKLLISTEGF